MALRVGFRIREDIPLQVGDIVEVNGMRMQVVVCQLDRSIPCLNVECVEASPEAGPLLYLLRDIGARADQLLNEVLREMDGVDPPSWEGESPCEPPLS